MNDETVLNRPKRHARYGWFILLMISLSLFVLALLIQSATWTMDLDGIQQVNYWVGFLLLWLILGGFILSVSRGNTNQSATSRISVILLIALVVRVITVYLTQPVLSDDIWRYIHDGATLSQGTNPYLHAPADLPPDGQPVPQIIDKINNSTLVTIYQPTSQYVFAALDKLWSACPDTVKYWDPYHDKVFRLGFVLFDMLLIAVILAWLRDVGRSAWWAVAYAWHPLAISEVAGSGHQDTIGIAFLVTALWLTHRLICSTPLPLAGGEAGRGGTEQASCLSKESGPHPGPLPAGEGVNSLTHKRFMTALIAGIAFGLAVAVKPLVLPIALPMAWLLRKQLSLVLCAALATVLTTAALYTPFLLMPGGLAGMFETGRTFVDKWAFNGLLYPMFTAFIAGKPWVDYAAFAVLMGALITATLREKGNPARPAAIYLFASLLLSSTVHPWYLLWALALIPVWINTAFWVFSLTVVASYAAHRYEGYRVPQWVVIGEYLPVYALLLWQLTKCLRTLPLFSGRACSPIG